MDQSLIKPGDRLLFQPWPNTVGWTTERYRSLKFKYQGASPQDFRNQQVVVIGHSMPEDSFRVYFVGDTENDHFFCCAMFLEPVADCNCSGYDLLNFGCRCGAIK